MCVWSKRVVVCCIIRWHCCAHRRLCNFPDFFLLKIFFLRIVRTGNLKVPAVLERLRRQKEDGRLICAICAAPTVLVEAGVLDPDQHVTCYPTCSLDLDRINALSTVSTAA